MLHVTDFNKATEPPPPTRKKDLTTHTTDPGCVHIYLSMFFLTLLPSFFGIGVSAPS
jgi:hypothetical protein